MGVYIYVTKPRATMELILNGERVRVSLYRFAYKPYTWPEDNVKLDRRFVRPCVMAFAKKGTEPERFGMLVSEKFKPGDPFDPSDRVFLTEGRIWLYDDSVGCGSYCPISGHPMNEPEYEGVR
jgi:hypothetical protein